MSSIRAEATAPDPIFQLSARYREDTNPKKIDLGIGAYRSNEGVPWVLPVVHKVDLLLAEDPKVNHEYLPITGDSGFVEAAAKLVLGNNVDLSKVSSVQTLSGTGANHMGALLLARFHTPKTIWVSKPTWGNHHHIFNVAGLSIKEYPYWDGAKRVLDFDNLINTLETKSQPGDIILLHACAHNPTGVDPTRDQWRKIAEVVRRKQLFSFFDCAYQGFASGDLDNDAWAVRYFLDQKLDLLVCQSFAKNMGLYGERAGALHVVLHDATSESAAALKSQLASQTRGEISMPPAYGARIAGKILTSPELFSEWKRDISVMANRIKEMRASLRSELEALRTPGTWEHITSQIGMFSFTGLSPEQVQQLVDKYHVYLIKNGRISMAGVNTNNVKYLAQSIHAVVTGRPSL